MTPRLSPRPPRPRRMQSLQAWLLVALLLVAQALGLAHRVAHAPGLPADAVVAATISAPASATAPAAASADVHAHFHASHEAGSPECRLIDQLAHADALCGSCGLPPALPRGAAAGTTAALAAVAAGSAAAYLARGPPAGDSARISLRA